MVTKWENEELFMSFQHFPTTWKSLRCETWKVGAGKHCVGGWGTLIYAPPKHRVPFAATMKTHLLELVGAVINMNQHAWLPDASCFAFAVAWLCPGSLLL